MQKVGTFKEDNGGGFLQIAADEDTIKFAAGEGQRVNQVIKLDRDMFVDILRAMMDAGERMDFDGTDFVELEPAKVATELQENEEARMALAAQFADREDFVYKVLMPLIRSRVKAIEEGIIEMPNDLETV